MVHLDVDIYKSTLDCLDFFYSRVNTGSVILIHDYVQAAGVRKAFDEFFSNKPDLIIELPGLYCLMVKV
ncbi:MAG: TylF/MycF/NovP-related O-methyltransferase [Bacillota bacterium]